MKKELIKITTNEEGQKLVSARELHEGLKIKSRFNDWIINRIKKYDFIENEDYICFTKNLVTQRENGQKGMAKEKDYFITVSMAKELCMVENNDLGKQFRRYFIEAEKQLQEIKKLDSYMIDDPIERAKRWIEEAEERKALMEDNIKKDEEIKVLKPKAEFTDKFLQDDTLYKATDIAKEVGMTVTKFNKLLEGLGIQFKQGGKWYITSEYDGNGYTKPYTFEYKEGKIQTQMRWSSNGRKFILDTLESLGIIK